MKEVEGKKNLTRVKEELFKQFNNLAAMTSSKFSNRNRKFCPFLETLDIGQGVRYDSVPNSVKLLLKM